jgi:hypothetical protein
MKTIITAKINIHYYLLSTSVKLSTQVYWSDKKKIYRAEKYSTFNCFEEVPRVVHPSLWKCN